MTTEETQIEYPLIHTMEQGSQAWHDAKLGFVSTSHFSEVLAGGSGKTRLTYMKMLAYERIHNLPFPKKFKGNTSMDWGTDTEAEARTGFAHIKDIEIKQVGFVEYSEDIGCSPDGLIGDDGLIEIKCPDTLTHMDYITGKTLPKAYRDQIQGQLWVLDRQWCYFVSYDPRYPSEPFYWRKIVRDEKSIDELQVGLAKFIEDLGILITKLTENTF